ncbi:phage holin family protein [Pseudokineococcus sp. 1T1Z-3]|uniref:phage holin family protein n=1 Tax=Pseudokineococcus sp. 1T1Z-3 TaxID=3132745 RepID=UPI0030B53579
MRVLVTVVVNALALWVASLLVPGIGIPGDEGLGSQVLTYLVVGAVFGLVNAVVKPVVQLLALPLYVLTLGLVHLVINALMLMLAAWLADLTPLSFEVDGFWWAVLGALVISVVGLFVDAVTGGRGRG